MLTPVEKDTIQRVIYVLLQLAGQQPATEVVGMRNG